MQVRRQCDCRHDVITDTLVHFASQALIPSAVRSERLIHTSCPAVTMPDLEQADSPVTRNLPGDYLRSCYHVSVHLPVTFVSVIHRLAVSCVQYIDVT
jgi:hypothetical protein